MKYFLALAGLLLVVVSVEAAAVKGGKIRVYSVKQKGYIVTDRVIKSNDEWKKLLSPEQFEHQKCRPFRFAVELGDPAARLRRRLDPAQRRDLQPRQKQLPAPDRLRLERHAQYGDPRRMGADDS